MSDVSQPLLNAVSPTIAGTFYSTYFPTEDFRDFCFILEMPTTTGSGSDTIDFFIEESSDNSFPVGASMYKVRTVELTSPTGTQATSLTQVVGGTTLPAASNTATILRQKWQALDNNISPFIRVRYIVAGTATSFTSVTLRVLANAKI